MLAGIELFHNSLEKKCSLLHKRHVYLISQFYQNFVSDHSTKGFTKRSDICKQIYNDLNQLLNKIIKNKDKIINDKINDMCILTNEELHYANMLLSWQFSSIQWDGDNYYEKLIKTCQNIADDIRYQFDKLYNELLDTESELLTLNMDKDCTADPKIISNRELLTDKYSSWYKDNGELDMKESDKIMLQFKEWNLDCSKSYFDGLMKYNPFNENLRAQNYKFLTCDNAVLDLLDQIAPTICSSLYTDLNYVFGTNRVMLKLPYDKTHQERGIGLLKVPNKNKGQIMMKASLDCTDDPVCNVFLCCCCCCSCCCCHLCSGAINNNVLF